MEGVLQVKWEDKEAELKAEIVKHILTMKDTFNQVDYARQSLIDYDRFLPWLKLKQAVKEAMK